MDEERKCDCCNRQKKIVGVASSSIGPISIAWCAECLYIGAEPFFILCAVTDNGYTGFDGLQKHPTYHKGEYKPFVRAIADEWPDGNVPHQPTPEPLNDEASSRPL